MADTIKKEILFYGDELRALQAGYPVHVYGRIGGKLYLLHIEAEEAD